MHAVKLTGDSKSYESPVNHPTREGKKHIHHITTPWVFTFGPFMSHIRLLKINHLHFWDTYFTTQIIKQGFEIKTLYKNRQKTFQSWCLSVQIILSGKACPTKSFPPQEVSSQFRNYFQIEVKFYTTKSSWHWSCFLGIICTRQCHSCVPRRKILKKSPPGVRWR